MPFPSPGDPVVVWHEVPPSRQPREPHQTVVDHVGPKTFTVAGSDAVFNTSTGRSRTVRTGTGAFRTRTYIAVPANTDRGRAVLGEHRVRGLEDTAVAAIDRWRVDRNANNLRALIEALQELEDASDPTATTGP